MNFFYKTLSFFVFLFISGCCTIHETEMPIINHVNIKNTNIRLEGFELLSLRESEIYVESTHSNVYDFQRQSGLSGTSSSVGMTFSQQKDCIFSNSVTDLFEKIGFNIKNSSPDLILVGRVGNGGIAWENPAVYYRDAPIFIFSLFTGYSIVSCTIENDIEIIVYDVNGNRIKQYQSSQYYNAVSLALPYANFANDKAWEWYGARQAAHFALIDCINQFIKDYADGLYNNFIKSSN